MGQGRTHFNFFDMVFGRRINFKHPLQHGVRALVTLCEDFLDYGVPGLAQYHVPILRRPMRGQVERTLGIIGDHLAAGEAVWVHCMHGLDRTGCVIGSYLASSGQPPDEVLAGLLDRFPARRRQAPYIEAWRPYADIIRSFRQETAL